MPLDTCSAVEPCLWGWYQKVPAGWSDGTLYSYSKVTPGLIEISTLSLLPAGETHRPCECRLVSLKQWGMFTPPSGVLHFSTGRRLPSLVSNRLLARLIRTAWPGRMVMVGARKGVAGSTADP